MDSFIDLIFPENWISVVIWTPVLGLISHFLINPWVQKRLNLSADNRKGQSEVLELRRTRIATYIANDLSKTSYLQIKQIQIERDASYNFNFSVFLLALGVVPIILLHEYGKAISLLGGAVAAVFLLVAFAHYVYSSQRMKVSVELQKIIDANQPDDIKTLDIDNLTTITPPKTHENSDRKKA